MKNFLKLTFAVAFALLTFAACNDDLEVSPNESYYASEATITSSDANVTITGNDAEVTFKVEGGTVTFTVNCGCEWTATSYKPEYFTTSTTSTSVTITAVQNTVENELAGVVSLMTAEQDIQFARIQVYQSAYGAPEITVETTEWDVPAKGALTTEIAVTASDEWTAESADAWLTVEKTATGISLTATENETVEERTTKVTLTCTDGVSTVYDYVTVNQDALAYITLSNDTISFSNEEDTASVTVESNFDWDYSYDTSNGWFTITRNGDVLTITAAANETADEREGTVSFTAGDGAENVAEELLTIIQIGANVDDMIFTYTITAANTTTQLPLSETVNCTVDWGDGSEIETVTSTQPSHTYAEAGVYNVTVSGTVTGLSSNGISTASASLPITAVKQWGNTGLTSMRYALWYCADLVSLPKYTGEAFAKVTTFQYAFAYCPALEEIPEGIFDNCPSATSFQYTFRGCSTIAKIPGGLFDTCTAATTFNGTFYECPSIEAIPEGFFTKCSANVTSFASCFQGCTKLTAFPTSIFGTCTKNTTVANFFRYCSNIIGEIPAGLFDNCTAVTTFANTFDGCSGITKIPEGLFDKNTKVTTFSYTFNECPGITEIPTGLFDNNTAVTTFEYVFANCPNIEKIPAKLFANCTKVTSFSRTFTNNTSLVEIPEGLFDSNTAVTNFNSTFSGCTSLTGNIPQKLFSNNLKVTNFGATFSGDTGLTGESPYDEIDGVHVHIYDRENYSSIYTTPVVGGRADCFKNCTGLTDYYSIPSSWGGGGN